MINTIRVNYQGMRPYLQDAVIKANELLRTQQFYDNIACLDTFDMADVSPADIAAMIRSANVDMSIDLYYSISPVKNIDGYEDNEDPTAIHMNIWRIERPVASLCNTIIHSCVHAANARYNKYSFGHGDALPEGKENTAPYRIGNLAQRMMAKDNIIYPPLQHEIIEAGRRPIKDYLAAL